MTTVECPQCGSRLEAPAYGDLTCDQCGFSAPFDQPVEASAPAETAAPAERPPEVPVLTPTADPPAMVNPAELPQRAPAPYAYLLGVVGFLTFWMAELLLPFLLGVGAIVLGVMARRRDPTDKRSVPAIALGALALLAAGAWLLA